MKETARFSPDDYCIFDLDGTLVDSAPGILDTLQVIFERQRIRPALELTPSRIGPPLRQMLAEIAGTDDPGLVDRLATSFMEYYDRQGCLRTTPYPGVDAALRHLADRGVTMFLATNKRWRPTKMILDHLRWADLFIAAYAVDSLTPATRGKADLLERIIAMHGLPAKNTFYIGDRHDDRIAAQKAGLNFLLAAWGYDRGAGLAAVPEYTLTSPGDLLR